MPSGGIVECIPNDGGVMRDRKKAMTNRVLFVILSGLFSALAKAGGYSDQIQQNELYLQRQQMQQQQQELERQKQKLQMQQFDQNMEMQRQQQAQQLQIYQQQLQQQQMQIQQAPSVQQR